MSKLVPVLMRAVNFKTNFAGYVDKQGRLLYYDGYGLKVKVCEKHESPGYPLRCFSTFDKQNDWVVIHKEYCELCDQQ